MKRISLDDASWFDIDAATRWDESTYWNGSNHISRATNSQCDHEALYRTAKGRWVIRTWSQRQGVAEDYGLVGPKEACAWLIASGHDIPDELNDVAGGMEQ